MELLGSVFLDCRSQPSLQNHRIILHGKDSSCSPAQLPYQNKVSYGIRPALSGLSETFIMSLGNLLQNLTILMVKNFLPIESQSCELIFSLCCSFSSQQLAWVCVLDLCWKVLRAQGCSASAEQCSHRVKDLSASHCLSSLEVHKKLGGSQLTKLTPTDPRDSLPSLETIKHCERMRKVEFWHFAYAVCLPKYTLHMMNPCFHRHS